MVCIDSVECWLQALFDLEATNQELKSDLRDLYITGAREIDVSGSRKAIIVHVRPAACRPVPASHFNLTEKDMEQRLMLPRHTLFVRPAEGHSISMCSIDISTCPGREGGKVCSVPQQCWAECLSGHGQQYQH